VVQNSSRPRAGFNLDFVNSSNTQISGLAVVSGQGSYMSGNEMTHSSAKTINGGQATWQFTLNAPSTPGVYTLRVAGNATQNGSNGDARTTTQTIVVKGVTLTAPTGGSTYCVGGTLPIQWTSYGVSTVNIQLSADGGANYSTIASPASTNGSNNYNYTIPTSTTAGTTYRVRVVDASDATLLSAMASDFTITSGLSIVTQPSPPNRTACQGSTVSYSVVVSGASPTFQWRKDGTNLPGATGSLLTLANVTSAQAGSYDCVVSSSCGSPVTSAAVTLAVDPATSITTQPSAVTVCEGSPINLSVTASGSSLQYQWKKAGTDIPGATRSTLNIPMSAPGDAGAYTCTVTGACGTPVTSSSAAVTVSSTPVFSNQPKDLSQCEGTAATMAATVTNASGLSFEWLKDGVVVNATARVTGVNSQTLNIASLQAGDAGTYQLRAFSPVCSATVSSNTAALVVKTLPLITTQPQSRTVVAGSAVDFSVVATGNVNSYQWKKDGNIIAGQTQSTYQISSVAASNAGSYTVTVSNSCGTVTSAAAVLKVSDVAKPEIVVQGTIVFGTKKIGSTATSRFTIINAGSQPVVVQSMIINGTDAADFRIDTTMPTIPPAGSVQVPVRYTFTKLGAATASITIKSDAANEPSVACSASGVLRAVLPELVIFSDSVAVGATRDTVVQWCNATTEVLQISAVNVSGDAAEFGLASTLPTRIGVDSCAPIAFSFNPTKSGRAVMYAAVVTNQGTDTIAVVAFGKSVISSVTEIESQRFATPTPASDFVRLSLPMVNGAAAQSPALVTVTDARGLRVYSASWFGAELGMEHSFSVQNLSSGVYTILVEQGTRLITQPLIIVR
jgi:hypothetical protein